MNKLCLLACLFMPIAGNAQTTPKVVFTGDDFTFAWQSTPQFTANHNWIGAGIQLTYLNGGSGQVLAVFQTKVIDQHPAYVHILTGGGDVGDIHDSTPLGVVWHEWQEDIEQMVAMAQKAGIKVILGNIPAQLGVPDPQPQGVQFFNAWLADYGLANNIPVVNYHDALCQCVGSTASNSPYSDTYALSLSVQPPPDAPNSTPNSAGYALITQMAQIAIETYGLTIKSGYLANAIPVSEFNSVPPSTQQNLVSEGQTVIFTPQAKWSDGVVRPILNQDFNGLKGTWTSSNPAVMYINQQGQAFAYSAGTATISFKAANGVPFSPWVMTVEEIYPGSI